MLTGHYPPEIGGVADFTRHLARGLVRAGDVVHVWTPSFDGIAPADPGVHLHPLAGRFTARDLRRMSRELDAFASPRRLLVQWVPHAFGWQSMNVRFALWLWLRHVSAGDTVEVVAHEGGLGFGEGGMRHHLAAVIHRVMAFALVHAARRIWVTTPEWARRWNPLRLGRRVEFLWLPIPSVIPVHDGAAARRAAAELLDAPGWEPRDAPIVAHFGTFGRHHLPQLEAVFSALLAGGLPLRLALLGPGGERLRDLLAARDARWASRIVVTGALDADVLSACLARADLLVQPYTDGVTARRTSIMAPIEHGRPVVTTSGFLTEPVWRESGGVALAPADDADAVAAEARRLLADAERRRRLGEAGRALYERCFALERAVAAVRGDAPPSVVRT